MSDTNSEFFDGLTEPTVVLGCPGAPIGLADLGPDDDDDEWETEESLSLSDWWDVGYVDGLYSLKKRPPLDPARIDKYRDGYAAGCLEKAACEAVAAERKRLEEERSAWDLPPYETDEIPF